MEGLVGGGPAGLPDPAFWAGRSVLLTGDTGFKGAWLALWLTALGAKVTGIGLAPGEPSLFALAGVDRAIDHAAVDIREPAALAAVVAAARPEIVLHLAAQSLVRPSYDDPTATYATNVTGTINLLEAVRATPGVRLVVVVTSDKCYENTELGTPFREGDPLGGHDPYSSSKACQEIVAASWRRSFLATSGVRLASARAGNVIGGGDWAVDRLIPDCIRAFLADEAIEIRSPNAVRPWQHVLEPLAGYLVLAERMAADERFAAAWNFGPAETDVHPVGTVVERVIAGWGGGECRITPTTEKHEAKLLTLDSGRARAELGWRPRLAFAEAVAWTVDWYRAFARGDDLSAFTLRQIEDYASRHAHP